jgi:hypothetical protein
MPPQCSRCLPSLASLSHATLSRGAPTGERFDDYNSARGSVPPRFEQKGWWAEDAGCTICYQKLSQTSDANTRYRQDDSVPVRENSKEIMALTDDPDCGHVFHFACLQTWVLAYDDDNNPERPLRCPVCSSSISKRNLEELVESTILEGEVEQLPEVEYEETERGAGGSQ